jgi:threonine dehydratase
LTTLTDLRAAEAVVRRYFPVTPLIGAPRLSAHLETEVSLKLECCTPIRTFKLRGALVKMQSLVASGQAQRVATASAGNHGLAVARAARLFGVPAVVCVPAGANPQKIALIAAEGAQVVEGGVDFQAAYENCLRIAAAESMSVIHAYDDPYVIAGQGTIGLELVESGLPFDTVIMGVGGGGLISGVAAALKQLKPGVRVIGVEPEGADALIRSVEAGRVVELERVQTIADGLGARKPGEQTLAHALRYVDQILRVSDEDLRSAMRFLLQEERLVVEPSGAAGVAALLKYGAKELGRVAVIISGANIADSLFAEIRAM